MRKRSVTVLAVLLATLLFTACGGSGDRAETGGEQSASSGQAHQVEVPVATESSGSESAESGIFRGFDTLPEDRAMPTEELDSSGYVVAESAGERGGLTGIDPLTGEHASGAGRSTSVASGDCCFATGTLRIDDAGTASPLDQEGLLLAADPSGGTPAAHAVYRLAAEGTQPSMVTTDINLDAGEQFWLAVADYGAGRWQFKGPFTDGRLRIALDSSGESDFISGSGNVFLGVITESEDGIEITGVGTEQVDPSDSDAPQAPANLSATPAAGGVLLEWDQVGSSDDLAGYRIYRNSSSFSGKSGAFASSGVVIQGRSDYLFRSESDGELFFRVAAVDTHGNESGLSDEASASAGSGSPASGALEVSRVAGEVGAELTLDASSISADSYDWDLDGDGNFEDPDSADATKDPVTFTDNAGNPTTGIFRPAVRAKNADGEVTAFAAASTVIRPNLRPALGPVVFEDSSGNVLNSATGQITVTAKAHFNDLEGSVTEIGWDLDGDRDFDEADETTESDPSSPATHQIQFTDSGLHQVNVRVVDDEGAETWAWSSFMLESGGGPQIAAADASPNPQTPGSAVNFTASANDPDGSIQSYQWDFGDGNTGTGQSPSHTYSSAGSYTVTLTVTDDDGNSDVQLLTANIEEDPDNIPPSIEIAQADPDSGKPGVTVSLTASATDPEGAGVSYSWNIDNQGGDEYTGSTASHTYNSAGFKTVKLQVEDGDGGISTAFLGVDVEHNLAPRIGDINISPRDIYVGFDGGITQFDMIVPNADDPDGDNSQLEYNFDPSGEGNFFGWQSSSSEIGNTLDRTSSGKVQATVKVRDQEGVESQATSQITAREFLPTVGPAQSNFNDSEEGFDLTTASLMQVESENDSLSTRPAVAYRRDVDPSASTDYECYYAMNLSPEGDSTWDHNGVGGVSNCFGLVGGAFIDRSTTPADYLPPVIASYHTGPSPDEIRFARSDDDNGLGSWTTMEVHTMSGDTTTNFDAIDVIKTVAATDRYLIAYVDDGHLHIAISDDLSPNSSADWTEYQLLGPSAGNDQFTPVEALDLALVNQSGSTVRPAIAWHDDDGGTPGGTVSWIVADVANPTSASDWGSPIDIDGTSASGSAIDAGEELSARTNYECTNCPIESTPMIAYYDATNNSLKLAASITSTGTASVNWSRQSVDSGFGDDVGRDPVLLQANTGRTFLTGLASPPRPTIFYANNTDDTIEFAQHTARSAQPGDGNWEFGTIASLDSNHDIRGAVVSGFPSVLEPDDVASEEKFEYIRPIE